MCSCAVAHIILMKPNGGSDRCSREKSLRIIHAANGFRNELVRRHGDDGWLRMARVGSASNTIDMRFDSNARSEEHTSELQSHSDLVCRLLLEKKKIILHTARISTHSKQIFWAV